MTWIIRTLGFVLVLSLLVGAGPPPAGAAELRLNSQWPATAAGSKIDKWFADEVARRTGGEVTIRIFWSSALGDPKETLELLRKGAVDMAVMSPGYHAAAFPFIKAPNSLPLAMDNARQASVIMHRLMDEVPAFQEEAAANNIKPLFFHVLNPYYFVCKEPFRKVEDLRGRKIRTWGNDMPRLMQAVGAVPVTLGLAELYEGLQRGTVDCIPFSVDLIVTYKIYEVAKHVTKMAAWAGPTAPVWVNLTRFNALAPAHQKVLLEVAEEAKQRTLAATEQAAADAMQLLPGRGVEFVELPDSERQKIHSLAPDFFADWVKEIAQARPQKVEDARKAVALWKKLRSEIR